MTDHIDLKQLQYARIGLDDCGCRREWKKLNGDGHIDSCSNGRMDANHDGMLIDNEGRYMG